MNVVVTGLGLLSSLGNLTQTWQGLLAGKSGLKLHQPFWELPPRPLGLIDKNILHLTDLTSRVVMDALTDANLLPPLPNCGVVIGSSRGCQGLWEQWLTQTDKNRSFVGLESWLDTLAHQGAVYTARLVGTQGPVLAPMAACATGIWAIAQGVELIQQGKCERVIAGAVEVPITPLTLAGFEQMGALAKTGCYPFDKNRQGLVLAQGGAVLVLESEELAKNRGASTYGKILGSGLTCDAYHLTTPEPNYHSATLAIKQCLERSDLNLNEIDYIHAHGTGTYLNDEREARLIQSLFNHRIAVSSTKGATGHTLGASGAIGIAFCLMALHKQKLPPCVGLKESAFDLDLVTEARQQEIRRVLCFSFGFGGQNGVIALSDRS